MLTSFSLPTVSVLRAVDIISGATWNVMVQREKHWWERDGGPSACLVPHQRGKSSSLPLSPLHMIPRWKFSLQEQGLESFLSYRNTGILWTMHVCCTVHQGRWCFFSCCIKSHVSFEFFPPHLRSHLVQVFVKYLNLISKIIFSLPVFLSLCASRGFLNFGRQA